MNVFLDFRWSGEHGIGRFTRELDKRLNLPHLPIGGNPASPLDPLRLMLAIHLRTPKNSLIFNPGYNAPLFITRPYVFTIMDLNHIDRPENSSIFKKLYYYIIIRRAAQNTCKVLTISEFSRQRIMAFTGINAAKIVNVGCGVSSDYRPGTDRYEPGFPFLLCVSNRKAHKNECRLIESFSKASIDPRIRLVFTGDENDLTHTWVQRFHLEDRVLFIGKVPEKELPSIYRGARALVFPSLYEGFGLPVLEAMACGIPVITSNCTALPEVAGDACLLIDPLNTDEIASAIYRLVADENLRTDLCNKGLEQATLFSWDKTAMLTRNALVLSDSPN